MVIKTYWEHWDTYAEKSKLSGVRIDVELDLEDSYMLFGKHQIILKLARLLGRNRKGVIGLSGPIGDYLCR